jgi:predicted CoA-substrate-specific enzyme activase
MNAFMGIDSGAISTKGIIIDEHNTCLASSYVWTEGSPLDAVKKVLDELQRKIEDKYHVSRIGVTGSARKLIGTILHASCVKNEITAHAVGTLSLFPNVRTIFEIGGQDSKIILIKDGIVIDYAMNTLCAAGTGAFLSSQAKRLGLSVEDLGSFALRSKTPAKIAARCAVFAESDLIHKAQLGYKKEDIAAGLCNAVVSNFLNNVARGKQIHAPIVFQGGVSKNEAVLKGFKNTMQTEILVSSDYSHLMGALGAAILSRNVLFQKSGAESIFDFNLKNISHKTKSRECTKCPNNCEIIEIYRNETLLDSWGNKCDNGK